MGTARPDRGQGLRQPESSVLSVKATHGAKSEILLGVVLLAAALLVSRAGFHQIALVVAQDLLNIGPVAWGIAVSIGGIVSLVVSIIVAVQVDRGRIRPFIASGALVTGAGYLLLALTGSLWWLFLSAAVTGVGLGMVASVILYSIAAKGAVRFRGTVIGLLAFAVSLDSGLWRVLPDVDASSWRWVSLLYGGLAVMAALLLFKAFPKVFPVRRSYQGSLPSWRRSADEEPVWSLRQFRATPGFWRVVGGISLVFVLAGAFSGATRVHLFPLLDTDSFSIADLERTLDLWAIVAAFGALLWGAASDFVRAPRLIPLAGSTGALGLILLWLSGGGLLTAMAIVILGLAAGATLVLPWVLLADHLGVRHFAVIGILVSVVTGFLSALIGPLLVGLTFDWFDATGQIAVLASLALVLVIAGSKAPTLKFVPARET